MILETLAAGVLALAAAPQRLVVDAGAQASVTVTNAGLRPVVVDTAPAGYTLDLRGRPRIGRSVRPWFSVAPRALLLAPGRQAVLRVAALGGGALPGDHAAVLLLASRVQAGSAVRVQVRVGVVVVVRVPGRLVRRLTLGRLVVVGRSPRLLRLVVANRGNVDQWIGRGRLTVSLVRRGRRVAVLHARARRVLARSRGVFELRLARPLQGELLAVVTLRAPPVRAIYRVRVGRVG